VSTSNPLYARVSSDALQKEGTIESQIVELKRQIAAAGHVLIKEYIDDGITGALLDRPALDQLRQDARHGFQATRPIAAIFRRAARLAQFQQSTS
jgi:DNA invertase Pin-like site-specific DNA recombinase